MFRCFHCGARAVVWQSDFSYEDCGYEGNGIVQFLTCAHCGAEIEYRVPLDIDEPEEEHDVEQEEDDGPF